jgi:uncharacterized protein (TIGR03437 family)
VVSQASQIPTTLAGGPIARGAVFTIRGVRFGSAAVVTLHNGNVASPVGVLAVQPEKIEAIMPDAAPVGPAALVVTAGGSASKPFSMEVAASNPGLFSQNKKGWGPGQIENIDAAGKRTLNSAANPAAPGQRVTMRITGLGKGLAAIVVVGNRTVNAGLARAVPQRGEQEISFAIPLEAPLGCYVPVYLQASPTRASNVVTMALQSKANRSGKCDSGPIPFLEAQRMDAQRIGMVVATRTNMLEYAANTNRADVIAAFSVRDTGLSLSPLLLLPPPGTCTTHTGSFQTSTAFPSTVSALLLGELGTEGLAAGPQLAIGRDKQQRVIPGDRDAIGYYRGKVPPGFFRPGKFFVSGAGGLDVGPFRVTTDTPAPFAWTDRRETEQVTRSQGLTLHWRGPSRGHWMILIATNVDLITTAFATCVCVAPMNATYFQIPAALLANIPASYDAPGTPYDQLIVASMPARPTSIPAPGLGAGMLFTIYANVRSVRYH